MMLIHLTRNFIRAVMIQSLVLNFKIKLMLQNAVLKRRSHTDDYFQFDFFTYWELRLSPLTMLFTKTYLKIGV